MTLILHLLERLWNAFENVERRRREAWLAESADVYELESRIRDLERHATRGSW